MITVEVIGADVNKQKMNLPSIAIHVHHNGAAAVYHENQIIAVIELERLVNLKNASWDFFEPIHSKDFVLKAIYDYLKEKSNPDTLVIMLTGRIPHQAEQIEELLLLHNHLQ